MSENKKARNIGIGVACAILLAGATTSAVVLAKAHDKGEIKYPWETSSSSTAGSSGGQTSQTSQTTSSEAPERNSVDTTITANGVVLSLLSTSTDAEGNVVRIFNYAVTPANATDQSVTLSLAWTDKTYTKAVGSYLKSSLDLANKKITVTILQDFDHQATLTIAANADATKTASVAIDCVQKFPGWKAYSDLSPIKATFDFSALDSLSWDANLLEWGDNYHKVMIRSGATDFSNAFISMTELKKPTTGVYSKAVEFTYSVKFGAEVSTFKWTETHKINNYGQTATTDLTATDSINFAPLDFSAHLKAGSSLTKADFRLAIQSALNAMSSTARAKLNSYMGIGMLGSTSLVCTCSDGQTATYPMALDLVDGASNYTL